MSDESGDCARLGELHEFWFAGDRSWGNEEQSKRWFMGGADFDKEINDRFAGLPDEAAKGAFDQCASDDRHAAALVVALDQLPRNIHRGKAGAFAHDAKAIALSQRLVQDGRLSGLWPGEQIFVLMPYQHCEDMQVQEEGVRLFAQMVDRAPTGEKTGAENAHKYAVLHRDIIARFGRFPHRNAALRRTPTADEEKWLAEGGETFGQ